MSGVSRSFLSAAALALVFFFAINPATTPAKDKKPSTALTLEIAYAWPADSIDDITPDTAGYATLTLKQDGTVDVFEYGELYPNVGTWSMSKNAKSIQMSFPAGGTTFEGTRQKNGDFYGSFSDGFLDGVWIGHFAN